MSRSILYARYLFGSLREPYRSYQTKGIHEIHAFESSADVFEFMSREGADPVASSPEELSAYFKREIAKYAKVIRAGNISV